MQKYLSIRLPFLHANSMQEHSVLGWLAVALSLAALCDLITAQPRDPRRESIPHTLVTASASKEVSTMQLASTRTYPCPHTEPSVLGPHLQVSQMRAYDSAFLQSRLLHACACAREVTEEAGTYLRESRGRSRSVLRILVLGGSMAQGMMNCCCGRCSEAPSFAWGALLKTHLEPVLGCRVNVTVNARGGRTSIGTALELETLLSGRYDAVLLDQSINDIAYVYQRRCDGRTDPRIGQFKCEGLMSPSDMKRQYLLAAIESIVRRIHAAGMPTMLVDSVEWQWNGTALAAPRCPRGNGRARGEGRLEGRGGQSSVVARGPYARGPYARGSATSQRTSNSNKSLYAPIAAHYRLPYANLQAAACAASPHALEVVWRAGCSARDAPGWDCFFHPGPTAHDALARLVAHTIATILTQGGATTTSNGTRMHWRGVTTHDKKNGRHVPPALLPPRTLRPAHRPTLQPEFEVANFEICTELTEKTNLYFAASFGGECLASMACKADAQRFQPVNTLGWAVFEDRPGKPGWISTTLNRSAPPSTISFNVKGSPRWGTIFIGYLRSYDRAMGRAKIWLDGSLPHAIALNGHWEATGSQEETAVVPFRKLFGGDKGVTTSCVDADGSHSRTAAGCASKVEQHTLNVEALGLGKFKITRIRTCENRSLSSEVVR